MCDTHGRKNTLKPSPPWSTAEATNLVTPSTKCPTSPGSCCTCGECGAPMLPFPPLEASGVTGLVKPMGTPEWSVDEWKRLSDLLRSWPGLHCWETQLHGAEPWCYKQTWSQQRNKMKIRQINVSSWLYLFRTFQTASFPALRKNAPESSHSAGICRPFRLR